MQLPDTRVPDIRVIDARGMRCPWPALRLARAVRDGGTPARYRLLADDPRAAGEIAALATMRGWRLEQGDADGAAAYDLWT